MYRYRDALFGADQQVIRFTFDVAIDYTIDSYIKSSWKAINT